MPSPRPSGSGALKILLFPQLLEHHILYFIALSGYSVKPVLGLLLWVMCVSNRPCYLDRFFLFVVIVCGCKACAASPGLIEAVLRAVSRDMPLLSTNVTGDVCEIGSPTACQKSSSRWGNSSPPSSSSPKEGVIRLVLCSLRSACA